MGRTEKPPTETEDERMDLLRRAGALGINYAEIGTKQSDGSVTLDWDVLADAVAATDPQAEDGGGE